MKPYWAIYGRQGPTTERRNSMASPIQKIKEFISPDDESVLETYRCHACDTEFSSAKVPERAQCPECLDSDVEQVDQR